MYEKVNPSHPDKVADRIAGALVDLAYSRQDNPKVAVEVLIGHSLCHIIAESSVHFSLEDVLPIVHRIAGQHIYADVQSVQQDAHLADNQQQQVRCGDNGIFKGVPVTMEQQMLADLAAATYAHFPSDGKYIINKQQDELLFTLCQSNAESSDVAELLYRFLKQSEGMYGLMLQGVAVEHNINPLGEWTGGLDVDTGATNRKLGSDMGDAVTGGGLVGKDLSKADVSCNIVCHLLAQEHQCNVTACCAIGDDSVTFHVGSKLIMMRYCDVVAEVRKYIDWIGGFEKLAEWGLIRPSNV